MSANNPVLLAMSKLSISNEKLAGMLSVTRQTLKNYIDDPDKIPLSVIMKLSSISGYSVAYLLGEPDRPSGPSLSPEYENAYFRIKEEIRRAEDFMKTIDMMADTDRTDYFNSEKEKAKAELCEIIKMTKQSSKKAMVCCFGSSDSGKSTLNNLILGSDIIPTGYNPLTSVVVVFHHISEKPSYVGKLEDGVVFGRKIGENDNEERFSFLNKDIYNADAVGKYVMRDGDYKSVLSAFTVKGSAYLEKNTAFTVDEVHIFLDNDNLKELTLVDVPGFNTGDENDDISLTMEMASYDYIFYLSQADAFMRAEDMVTLGQILRSRENLDSVEILATHASSVGNPEEIDMICNGGCERFFKSLAKEEAEKYTYDKLKERFHGFDISMECYVSDFNLRFQSAVRHINSEKANDAMENIKKAYAKIFEEYSKKEKALNKALSPADDESRKKALKEVNARYEVFCERIDSYIEEYKENSEKRYEKACDKILNKDGLTDLIKSKGIKNKKDSRAEFANYINNEINYELVKILKEESEAFNEQLNSELDMFQKAFKYDGVNVEHEVDMKFFNAKRVFLSGLAGTTGAFAVWTSAVALGGHIGVNVIAGNVVSAMTTGLIAGSGSALPIISAVGGPVALAVGLGITSALVTYGLTVSNWERPFADRLIRVFKSNKIYEKGIEAIEKYWKETADSAEKCEQKLYKESFDYLKKEFDKVNLEIEKNNNLNGALKILYGMLRKFCSDKAEG